jgi:hypothetical protein
VGNFAIRGTPPIDASDAFTAPELPTVLPRIAFKIEYDGQTYTATFGRFPDGRPSEIYLRGSTTNNTLARLASLLLQAGVPIADIRQACLGTPLSAALDRVISFDLEVKR